MAKAKMKNKSKHYISIDLDNRYMSTYHFVGFNELSNVANMLWGKGWIAEDDISQIQELLDHVEKDMYTVHHVKGLRDDYDIEIRLNGTWRLQKQINWFNDFGQSRNNFQKDFQQFGIDFRFCFQNLMGSVATIMFVLSFSIFLGMFLKL